MVTGLLRFRLSGADHPTSGVVTRESAYDAGVNVRHTLLNGEGEAIQREQLMQPLLRPGGQTRQHVGQPRMRLQAVHFRCLKQAHYLRRTGSGCL